MEMYTYEQKFGKPLTIRELFQGFQENARTGEVTALDGKLDIHPPYQREFIYEPEKQKAVINTVLSGYPLNSIYWAETDGRYEVIDGQQRIMSICYFLRGEYSVEVDYAEKKVTKGFEALGHKREDILDYPLSVYICKGDEEEIKAWFKIINITGTKLTEQEMRNSIYNSDWINDAKLYFSLDSSEGFRSEGHILNGYAYGDYLNVVGGKQSEKENAVVRQKLLEIVLTWAVDRYNKETGKRVTIEEYMDLHSNDGNAKELWRYYEDVMEWVKKTFPTYNDLMKKVDWGILYNAYGPKVVRKADEKVATVLENKDEISNLKDVYKAVLAEDMRFLNARTFGDSDKKWAYEKQKHLCPYCRQEFAYAEMQGDHIIPWSKGGKTEHENLQMLCAQCNLKKAAYDVAYRPWDKEKYKKFSLENWEQG